MFLHPSPFWASIWNHPPNGWQLSHSEMIAVSIVITHLYPFMGTTLVKLVMSENWWSSDAFYWKLPVHCCPSNPVGPTTNIVPSEQSRDSADDSSADYVIHCHPTHNDSPLKSNTFIYVPQIIWFLVISMGAFWSLAASSHIFLSSRLGAKAHFWGIATWGDPVGLHPFAVAKLRCFDTYIYIYNNKMII